MLLWENRAFKDGFSIIIGMDEAGRGPLAGPVVAVAVILSPQNSREFTFPEYKERIDDSKKLSASQRERSYREILKKSLFGLGIKNRRFIDKKNIHTATLAAMSDAVKDLIEKYCRLKGKEESDIRNDICVLVDGNCKPPLPYRIIPIVNGDSKSLSVAAASIIAKVERDRMMTAYDKTYPLYGFSRHKGYGTRLHFEALEMYGPCAIHRRSFTLTRSTK